MLNPVLGKKMMKVAGAYQGGGEVGIVILAQIIALDQNSIPNIEKNVTGVSCVIRHRYALTAVHRSSTILSFPDEI